MKRFLAATLILVSIVVGSVSAIAETKCDGPPDLCAQVTELQEKLQAEKDASAQKSNNDTNDTDSKMAEAMASAAVLATILKTLMSYLRNYKGYFTTDKGKAGIRISLVLVGLAAFAATNVGFGMTWWQAIIVAGGGPGAIALHELMKLIPVILGKGPLPPETEPSPPTEPSPTA